jgi:hypothetical protein
MTNAPTPTPEFLIWAIELRCRLRDIEGLEQPERTDRQLRAVRAVSDARHAGRQFEGLCIARTAAELAIPSHAAVGVEQATAPSTADTLPQAFRLADALSLFGEESAIESACRGCPANSTESRDAESWAGCYGIVPLPQDSAAFHAAMNAAVQQLSLPAQSAYGFLHRTLPAWYGLWLGGPLTSARSEWLRTVVERAMQLALQRDSTVDTAALEALALGLAAAATAKLPMHVALYPRGAVSGRWWTLEPSCPRCRATLVQPAERCPVCGWTGKQGTPPKRRSRGTRPYRPLRELGDAQQLAGLLLRYRDQRLV